jgi:hypothetical protein
MESIAQTGRRLQGRMSQTATKPGQACQSESSGITRGCKTKGAVDLSIAQSRKLDASPPPQLLLQALLTNFGKKPRFPKIAAHDFLSPARLFKKMRKKTGCLKLSEPLRVTRAEG